MASLLGAILRSVNYHSLGYLPTGATAYNLADLETGIYYHENGTIADLPYVNSYNSGVTLVVNVAGNKKFYLYFNMDTMTIFYKAIWGDYTTGWKTFNLTNYNV